MAYLKENGTDTGHCLNLHAYSMMLDTRLFPIQAKNFTETVEAGKQLLLTSNIIWKNSVKLRTRTKKSCSGKIRS